jgi:hypothetical protein
MSRPSLENEITTLARKLRDKKARLRASQRAARADRLALLGGLFETAGLAQIDAQEAAGALGLYAVGLTKPGAEELQRRAREKGAELLP